MPAQLFWHPVPDSVLRLQGNRRPLFLGCILLHGVDMRFVPVDLSDQSTCRAQDKHHDETRQLARGTGRTGTRRYRARVTFLRWPLRRYSQHAATRARNYFFSWSNDFQEEAKTGMQERPKKRWSLERLSNLLERISEARDGDYADLRRQTHFPRYLHRGVD